MLKYFYLGLYVKMCKTFISRKASVDNWEVASELMQGWKKGCNGGKLNRKREELTLRYVRF